VMPSKMLWMFQFVLGFSLGVYVGTEYDLSPYVEASKDFFKNIKKKDK